MKEEEGERQGVRKGEGHGNRKERTEGERAMRSNVSDVCHTRAARAHNLNIHTRAR